MTHFTWHLAYTLACTCTTEHLATLTQTKRSVNLLTVFLHVCMHIIWPIKVHNLTQECTKQSWWDWGKKSLSNTDPEQGFLSITY